MFALFSCSSNLWVILEEGAGFNKWPVALPVFSEVNLNMHSQSDISQSRWIYCVCWDWLDCPVDKLLPGKIMDNALQCTVHAPTHPLAAAWSPGMEYNCSAGGRQSQATSYHTGQIRANLCTSIQWAQYTNMELQARWHPGSEHRIVKLTCQTADNDLSACLLHAILVQRKGR